MVFFWFLFLFWIVFFFLNEHNFISSLISSISGLLPYLLQCYVRRSRVRVATISILMPNSGRSARVESTQHLEHILSDNNLNLKNFFCVNGIAQYVCAIHKWGVDNKKRIYERWGCVETDDGKNFDRQYKQMLIDLHSTIKNIDWIA